MGLNSKEVWGLDGCLAKLILATSLLELRDGRCHTILFPLKGESGQTEK